MIADDASDFEDSDDGDNEQNSLDRLQGNIEFCSRQLDLSPVACRLSILIGRRAFSLDVLRDCSLMAKVVMSIFAASHLIGRPVTLEQISPVVELSRPTILDTYRLFYPEREAVIDSECLLLLGEDPERATTGSLPHLAWPRPEYTDAIWEMVASRFGTEHQTNLIEVSREFFLILVDKAYFDGENVMKIAALSICLASYLRHIRISRREIASVTGVSVDDIRVIYALFYFHRDDLLEHRAVDGTWMDNNFERLVNDLPLEVRSLIRQ